MVTGDGQLVLLGATDPPFARHERGVLAHRQSRAGLGVARDLGHQLLGSQAGERPEPPGDRARPAHVQERSSQVLVQRQRRVGRGVDAAGDADLDLPQRDLVGDQDRRLQTGPAGLLDVVGRGLGRQARAEHRLTSEVEVAAVLQDRARDDLADGLTLQPEPLGQRVERRRQHVLVGGLGVRAVLAGERDPAPPEDGNPADALSHLDRLPDRLLQDRSLIPRT